MRTQQPPHFPEAAVVLICYAFILSAQVATASGANNLSDGEIAGVVTGSVGGALVLGLLTVLVCCLRVARGRRTGDLTWSKGSDLEAAAIGQTPHHPLPGACTEEMMAVEHHGGGEDGPAPDGVVDSIFEGNANRNDVNISTATCESVATVDGGGNWFALHELAPSPSGSPIPTPSPSGARKAGFFHGRSLGHSVGSGVANFLAMHKGFLRHSGATIKDKHLEVSRSARVEPSAELELTEPFQPAATNMGPPLSKSSMLLRWLNGADEGLPEAAAAAAQVAAAATRGDVPPSRSSARVGAGRGNGGTAAGSAGLDVSLDRLPLLSLAAQQTGIVWNKMPPSVASSPAVSVVESSSMHMLRGTLKRSDAQAAAAAVNGNRALTYAARALAAWHGGDHCYPASLAHASVGSFSERTSQSRSAAGVCSNANPSGIVFDYVMRPTRSTASSRVNTGGGVASRAPTASQPTLLPVQPVQDPSAVVSDTATAQHWLHQTIPMKLTALQEAEMEEDGEEVMPPPLPLPQLLVQSSSKYLLPVAPLPQLTSSLLASGLTSPAVLLSSAMTHGLVEAASFGWTHFENREESAATGAGVVVEEGTLHGPPATVSRFLGHEPPRSISSSPVCAATEYPIQPGIIVSTDVPMSVFANVTAGVDSSIPGLKAGADAADIDVVRGIVADGAALSYTISMNRASSSDTDAVNRFPVPGRRPSDLAIGTLHLGGAQWMSPGTFGSQLSKRMAVPPQPQPLHASRSNSSLRSQTSLVSPSLSIHYPEVQDGPAPESAATAVLGLALRRGSSIHEWASAAQTRHSGSGVVDTAFAAAGAVDAIIPNGSMSSGAGSSGSPGHRHFLESRGPGSPMGQLPPPLSQL